MKRLKSFRLFESFDVKYECTHCRSCFTADEWNEYNMSYLRTFGFPGLPEAKNDEVGRFDCPECGETSAAVDMEEY